MHVQPAVRNAWQSADKIAQPLGVLQSCETRDEEFSLAGGKTAKVPFMHQQAHFGYAEDGDVQVLELTYGKNDLAMRVFLPKKTDGLGAFEKQMTAERIAGIVSKLRPEEVNVSLPRFTIESQFFLAETLKAMGMRLAFERRAGQLQRDQLGRATGHLRHHS